MEHEALYRLSVFAGVFLSLALLELVMPRRGLSASKLKRWVTNISFSGLNTLLIRLMAVSSVPLVAIGVAEYGAQAEFGLLRQFTLPYWLVVVISLLVLDLAIYFQHFASHKVPLLWRVHRVHHSDVDFDVTTAVRFHPIEIGLSMLYKCVLVLLLGIDGLSVLLFEIILNGCAMFNHSNLKLPLWLDKIVRLVIVTPDMHRVHHSVIRRETDSNYGFSLAVWDRIFRTYNEQPEAGHEEMSLGLPSTIDKAEPTRFNWSFLLPFSK